MLHGSPTPSTESDLADIFKQPHANGSLIVDVSASGSSSSDTSSESGASTSTLSVSTPDARCLVCFRSSCQLNSHRLYVRRNKERKSNAVSKVTRPSRQSAHTSVRGPDGLEIKRLKEIGVSSVDPFFDFPLPDAASPEVHVLFKDFFTLHIPPRTNVGLQGRPRFLTHLMQSILPTARESPALCHSLVVTSALWHEHYRGLRRPSAMLLSLHGRAIQLLREAITQPSMAYSDAIITAAVFLTHHQILTGCKDGLEAHVQGIQALVSSRGGIHNVGGLAQLILWIDFLSCLYLDQAPLYTWPIDSTIALATPPSPIYGDAFSDVSLQELLDSDLLVVCVDTCRMVELLEKMVEGTSTPAELEFYRYKRSIMGLQHGSLHAQLYDQGTVDECVGLAINLLVLNGFYMKVLYASTIDLCVKLQRALLRTELKTFWDGQTDLLVWVLFVGSIISPSDWTGRTWFLELLGDALSFRHQSSQWPDKWREYARQDLERHVWSRLFLATGFENICKMLETKAIDFGCHVI